MTFVQLIESVSGLWEAGALPIWFAYQGFHLTSDAASPGRTASRGRNRWNGTS